VVVFFPLAAEAKEGGGGRVNTSGTPFNAYYSCQYISKYRWANC